MKKNTAWQNTFVIGQSGGWNDIRGRRIKRTRSHKVNKKIIPIMVNVGIHAEMILRRRIQIREVKVMMRKRRSERSVISIDFSAWLPNRWIFGKQFVLFALIYFLFFPFGLLLTSGSIWIGGENKECLNSECYNQTWL